MSHPSNPFLLDCRLVNIDRHLHRNLNWNFNSSFNFNRSIYINGLIDINRFLHNRWNFNCFDDLPGRLVDFYRYFLFYFNVLGNLDDLFNYFFRSRNMLWYFNNNLNWFLNNDFFNDLLRSSTINLFHFIVFFFH